MNLLTRLTATLGAETTRAVARFENHDAIAAAATRGAREAVTTARVRHARLLREGDRRREQLTTLELDETRWGERAHASAATDEANALACLEQRRATRKRIDDARQALAEHERLESEMSGRLQTLERRLAEITRRRDALRSRESIVRAGEVLDTVTRDDGHGIDDVFERWEVRIADTDAERAMRDEPTFHGDDDALARRYASIEHEASLRSELAELTGTSGNTIASEEGNDGHSAVRDTGLTSADNVATETGHD